MSQRYVIAVCGVPGAGKTTAVHAIAQRLTDAAAIDPKQADYRTDDSSSLIRLVQRLKDGQGTAARYALVEMAPLAVLRPLVDLTIGIDTPLDIALARRLRRDAKMRKVAAANEYLCSGAEQVRRQQDEVCAADRVLDGTLPAEGIAQQAIEEIRARFEPPLVFKRAGPGDLDTLHSIMEEAARWLASRGIMQWEWFIGESGRRHLARRLDAAEVYLAHMGNEAVATLTVQWDDAEFWGERGQDSRAGYVQGLAVRRAVAGRGIGEQLIAFAEQRTHEQGRRFLRLDCMADNMGLCGYYCRHGFVDQGVAELFEGRWKARLLEREIRAEADSEAGNTLILAAA